jgi:hypothetical protein
MIPRFALSVGTKVDRLVVVLVLAVMVVDDPQDLDEAEGGSPAAAGAASWSGSTSAMGRPAAAGAHRGGPPGAGGSGPQNL